MISTRKRKAFFRKTRKGKVVKIVHEKYLQGDHSCGYMRSELHQVEGGVGRDPISPLQLVDMISSAPHKQLIVIDTNIALHQLDVLQCDCPATAFIVILQTVIQELRHLNLAAYRRVLSLLRDEGRSFIFYPNELSSDTTVAREQDESANDFNDKAIVKAAVYFRNILVSQEHRADAEPCNVILVTNDVGNQRRAASSGIDALSMRDYVGRYVNEYPELMDLVAADDSASNRAVQSNLEAAQYSPHLPLDQILSGVKSRQLFRGTIHPSNDNDWSVCYVILHSAGSAMAGQRSVKIIGKENVNRATDGDVVAIELLPIEEDGEEDAHIVEADDESEEKIVHEGAEVSEPTLPASVEASEGLPLPSEDKATGNAKKARARRGRVVGIIRRNWRQLAGSLDLTSLPTTAAVEDATTVLFRPAEKRLPPMLLTTRRAEDLRGQWVVAVMDQWPTWSTYPMGHYISTLGLLGDKAAETKLVLHEFGVPHEAFSPAVMACLPASDWKITEEIAKEGGRVDLRYLPVVSIDPPGCKDIDDALHCIRLPNGRLEVGVHIADVTYFVHPDTPLDKEAAERSTSTYLVDRRLDMLPGYLTTQLCSLRSKEDHLAFSVIWEMDDQATILDVRFCKSVIHSVASLTYDEAQVMLDEPSNSSPVNLSVNLLNHLAKILRKRRIDTGALTLASPEVKFKLDTESLNPVDVCLYALKESNALVEEWMLLANITVAKKTLRHFPSLSVLRRHCPPSREQFLPLEAAAAAVGFDIDITSSKTLADSLDSAQREDDSYFNKLLRILATRCMMPAQYFCSGEVPKDQFHHYGLAAPVYTHFTSPIRRYADVLVHRLLAAAIGVAPLPASCSDRTKQLEQCAHMNRRHRAAQYAQRASVNMHTLMFFRQNACKEAAYVLSVSEERFSVLIPRFGIEGAIALETVCKALATKGEDVYTEVDAIAHRCSVIRKSLVNGRLETSILFSLQVFQRVEVYIAVKQSAEKSGGFLAIALVRDGRILEKEDNTV